jgi:phage terminase large subunit
VKSPNLNRLEISLQPKQSTLQELWDDKETDELGFGGARGGAKSGGGRRVMLWRRLKYAGTQGLILRRTYVDLYKSHITKMFEEFPHLRSGWRESHKELRLPNGSLLFFGSAEHEGDLSAFYSSEFADILVDEAQDFSQGELERLRGSNRSTSNPDLRPKFVCTFMPGFSESGLPPKGLTYLKRVFVEKRLEESEKKKKWAFIQAFAWDNVEWVKKELERDHVTVEAYYSWTDLERREYFLQSEYGTKLSSISDPHLRDAWLFGSWDVFIGQYFPQFSRQRHVISREELKERQRPWHRRWISGDWGYDHPHAVYFHSIDEHGQVITWGEIWGRRLNETDLGHRISAKAQDQGKFVAFPFSWDAGKQSPRSSRKAPRSIVQLVNESLAQGIPKGFPAESTPGTRISRARLTSQMLDSMHWMIAEDCPKLIECLPTLVRDPANTEDVLKVDYKENGVGDDPYDGATMGLAFMLGSSFKSEEMLLHERAMAIEDKAERFYFLYKETFASQAKTPKEKIQPSWQARISELIQ